MDQPAFSFGDGSFGDGSFDDGSFAPESLGDVVEEVEVPTFSVGELNALVRDSLRRSFPVEVWVRGEVQNLSRSGAGHTYFAVVEKAGRGDRVQARLDVALFRDDRRAVDRALAEVPGAELGNDVEVRIRGRVTVYPPTGRYQLVMTGIDPVFTVGGIAANRDRVLRALSAEGLLDANARHTLAPVPLRIGLITSAGSAAYHDFVHELERSDYAWQVAVVDVRVQGAAAARRIKWALGELSQLDVDAVVLVRGGGSRADLAPFDTELVARAIAAMPVPVITGVGHEVDRSVADEVAHTACKTPTACAQTLLQRVRSFVDGLDDASHRVSAQARRRMAVATRELDDATRRAARTAPSGLVRERARLDRAHGRVDELARRRAAEVGAQLDTCARRVAELGRRATRAGAQAVTGREREIITLANHHLSRASLRLDATAGAVRALDPRRVLERGYSITRDTDGRVLKRATAVAPGVLLETELAEGRVTSRVETITEEPGE
ncbi:MAG: exodeoxyribonuclease large subunit [Actinomycetota bacterium]|nr:exodeoxyribonuclease large subunit [Actinomycetota bacterium]